MLNQTKEQLQEIVGKIQMLDFIITTLSSCHKDDSDLAQTYFKQASTSKVKLVKEALRLTTGMELI